MASVASAATTTIVDPFSVRGSLLDNSIIRYCRAEWQVVIYGAHIHAGLPLKSLKIMRNPVSGTTRLFSPLFPFSFLHRRHLLASIGCDKQSDRLARSAKLRR